MTKHPRLKLLLTPAEDDVQKRLAQVAKAFMHESDRGCAVFGQEILNNHLEALLRAFMRSDAASVKQEVNPLFEGFGPLATFSARVRICYALRLITKETRDWLELVRRLRNDFAHESGPMTFDDPRCSRRLRLLVAEGKPRVPDPDDENLMPGHPHTSKRQWINPLTFILKVVHISGKIEFSLQRLQAGQDLRRIVEMVDAGRGGADPS